MASSQYSEAVRAMIEPQLTCRCGAMNDPDPRLRPIKILDLHGQTACDQCGRCGGIDDFRPERQVKEQHR